MPGPDARTVSVSHDAMQRVWKTLNVDGTYTTAQYDAAGNLVFQTDELGRVTRYVYDDRNRCIAVIRPDDTILRTIYDGGGRVVAEVDAVGNTTHYEYDQVGRKTEQVAPVPDGAGSLPSSTTLYGYDEHGNLQYVTDATPATTTAPLLPRKDASRTVEYEYDNFGRKKQEMQPDPDGTSGTLIRPVTKYDYDNEGNVTTVTDPRNFATTFLYDERDRKTQMTQQVDGSTALITRYYYDKNGNLQYVVDPAASSTATYADVAHTTEYQYDALNRKTKEILPDPDGTGTAGTLSRPVTTYAYDNWGNLASVTDPRGAVTAYAYDTRGRCVKVTDALGHTAQTVYDAVGNVLWTTDLDPATRPATYYTYDDLNRKLTETLPRPSSDATKDATTSYTYDANGNTTSITDPLNHTTWYQYDHLNRVTCVTDALANTAEDWAHSTRTYYDSRGNVRSVSDHGQSVSYTYDKLGRKTSASQAASQVTASHVILSIGAKSTANVDKAVVDSITVGADARASFGFLGTPGGDLAIGPGAVVTLGGDGPSSNTFTFTDSALTGSESSYIQQSFDVVPGCVYDPWFGFYLPDSLDSLHSVEKVSVQVSVDGGQHWSLPRSWDSLSEGYHGLYLDSTLIPEGQHVLSVRLYGIKGKTISYYPAQLRSYSTTKFTYDGAGNLSSTTDALGNTTWYTYDGLNRNTCVIDALGTAPTNDSTPPVQPSHSVLTTYDALGDAIHVSEAIGAGIFRVTDYAYDNLGRKTKEILPAAGNGDTMRPATYYGYDSNGNLRYVTDAKGTIAMDAAHTTWYCYDKLNRQTLVVDALQQVTYAIDAFAPNVTAASKPVHSTLTVYDNVGNIQSVTDANRNNTVYAYDLLHRVVSETGPFVKATQYEYDTVGNVIKKTDRNGAVTSYLYDALGHKIQEQWTKDATSVVIQSDGVLSSTSRARRTLARISSALAVQVND